MRGDGEDLSFDFETCRAAFELRASDARRRAGRALRRAKRIDDWDQAAALVKLIADNSNRRLAADDEGPTPDTIVHHRGGAATRSRRWSPTASCNGTSRPQPCRSPRSMKV